MLGLGIGLGTTLVTPVYSVPVVVPPAPIVPVDVALFTTVVGDGVTSLDTTNQSMSISYGTTATSLRSSAITVVVGKRYRFTWTGSGTNFGQISFGTSVGGTQYRGSIGESNGDRTFEFTASTTAFHVGFQRTSAGTTVFSGLTLQEIPDIIWQDTNTITPATWYDASAGVTVDQTTGDITIPSTGATLLLIKHNLFTVQGNRYRMVWTNATATTMCLIAGPSQYKTVTSSDSIGAKSFEFQALTGSTLGQFQRIANGTALITGIKLQIPAGQGA